MFHTGSPDAESVVVHAHLAHRVMVKHEWKILTLE
jgi:hypothetical protein